MKQRNNHGLDDFHLTMTLQQRFQLQLYYLRYRLSVEHSPATMGLILGVLLLVF